MRLKRPKIGAKMSTSCMYFSEDLAVMATWSITTPHLGQPSGDYNAIKGNVVLHKFKDAKLTQYIMDLKDYVAYFHNMAREVSKKHE